MPSEYVRRFTWCTLHDDRAAVLLRPYLGESHLLWSSAAPTSSTAWPGDLEAAEQLLSGLHDDAKRRLLADNCRRLFAIPGTDATVSDFTAGEIEAFTRTELFD
jgi:hypothetical protein